MNLMTPDRNRSTRRTVGFLSLAMLYAAVLPGILMAQAPTEDSQQVTVVLQGRQRPQLRLAMPRFEGFDQLTGSAREAALELEETLRNDLELSRIFSIQGPAELAVLSLTGNQGEDRELYRSLGNEVLLSGRLTYRPGELVIEGRAYDLASGQEIVGKRYRGNLGLTRRIAHTFADEIVHFFTGRPGIALTSIAFWSDRDGFREIYLMDYDGHNQRRISGHKSISMSPDWSPSSDGLAYVSYFAGLPGIYFADLATGRKLPIVQDEAHNSSPAFSPDGRRIAFARSIGGNWEIHVCNRDGSGMKRLTHSTGIDTNPAWSPTGRELAFTSSRTGRPQIYLMDSEGANLRRASFEGTYNDGAAWNPAGTHIAYASRRQNNFQIALTELVTLETQLLTNSDGNNESPSFSPDGRKIAFASSREDGRSQVWVMDANGNNQLQVTNQGRNWTPAWSPFDQPR